MICAARDARGSALLSGSGGGAPLPSPRISSHCARASTYARRSTTMRHQACSRVAWKVRHSSGVAVAWSGRGMAGEVAAALLRPFRGPRFAQRGSAQLVVWFTR